jgi:chromosome segregation ATPase
LEESKASLQEECEVLQDTVNTLTHDLEQQIETARTSDQELREEIQELRNKLTMTHNEQIDSLTRQLREANQRIEELTNEVLDVNTLWKGENEDLQNIYADADLSKRRLELEAAELESMRSKLESAFMDLGLQRQELEQERQMLQESARRLIDQEKVVDRPPDYKRLAVAFDSVLTDCARRVLAISRRETLPEKADLRQHLKGALPPQAKESLQPLKAFLLTLKEDQGRRLEHLKETVSRQVSLLQTRAASEGSELSRPLPSPNLSPIQVSKTASRVTSRLQRLADRMNEKSPVRYDSSLMLLGEESDRQAEFRHFLPKRETS